MEYAIVVMAVMTLASMCMCIALTVVLVRLERKLAATLKRLGSGEDDKPVKFVGPGAKGKPAARRGGVRHSASAGRWNGKPRKR